ncbi:sigma factor-like helix-turn-helix DNA-binding protein [Amycolatopsis sp. WAC 01376]|uniref:sigma factor-like helix-turn-helix DNA-binding protein n=1 Tax=Amycolatopsis sp. WAC 01376 TaxID=2203195 RepID=UPI0013155A26|nr:sigma factor-like helix-turn-helix DNA-binding protein [Amycolatopsis sp. WAC 01376]
MDAGKAVQAQGAALPGHIARLATSGLAEEAHEDTRGTPDLVADIAQGDRTAELPLYVRVATDLERTAARVAGDAALSREDLHQEGALRLIEDVRAGLVGDRFGGAIGPYIGRSLRRHLVDLVDSQRPGRPPIPGRERRRLREALNATANADASYNTLKAVQYARNHFGWSLAHFWAVHGSAFGAPVQWNDASSSGGLSFAETTADPAAAEALARVEDRDDVQRTIERAELTLREHDVIEAIFGFHGLAATTEETAELLGMSTRHVKRLRASALAKLTQAADDIGVTREHGADNDEQAPEIVQPRAPESVRCVA